MAIVPHWFDEERFHETLSGEKWDNMSKKSSANSFTNKSEMQISETLSGNEVIKIVSRRDGTVKTF